MPTYTYLCSICGQFDWSHSMDEEFLYCPKCGMTDFKKVFNNVGVSFKGSGFYSTDSR
jgi:putative FmdB family regulatory protein